MNDQGLSPQKISPKLLVVDDEPHNITLLKAFLTKMDYQVVGAENAIAALEILDRTFDLVLSDVMMPEMDGFELVHKIRENPETQHIPIIMVTTLSEKQDRLKAVEAGANDFISKPVDRVELQVRTQSLLRQKSMHDEILVFETELVGLVDRQTAELRRALSDLRKANHETVHRLAAAAEFKDDDTAAHIQRISRYCALLGEKAGLEKSEVALLRDASPMHDIGKIGIPDAILLKPGKLDPGEWEMMQRHVEFGGKILAHADSPLLRAAEQVAMSHHEKWDGSGYPNGLSGEEIPRFGRICAIADVFDALTMARPYKKAFSLEKSLGILKQGRGAHFDPILLDLFLENLDQVLAIKTQYPL